ncbi:hypothetical protein DEJ50_24605 [Streptomyces venezuelae]|uniref:Uncharacterized protein n=1 Tax=Streptomyces venezuelae TaxID=54571 RepID=A0A5P2D5X3_STRVZ|nr:hypothetical protein [Streptomyces venezuelae]QES50534.1 hypothetical protein DEJ50_24605 [Streptomyces venezuelae]
MGMYVLYGAFGLVALWLLAEVLLQYKARLRWRLLAFTGFLGVVAGVILPSVPVIGAGAGAFAIGQTLVTLSFRKGFVAGWALRRGADAGTPAAEPATGRRRSAPAERQEPSLRVSGLAFDAEDTPRRPAEEAEERPEPAFFSPQPLPEDTGSYGIQSFQGQDQGQGGHGHGGQGQGFAPDGFAPGGFAPAADPAQTTPFASPYTTAEQDAHQYAAYYDPHTQGGSGYDYSGGFAPGGEQPVYAAYSDPYIGTAGVTQPQPYRYADPYVHGQYAMDTPPGGVWVPQQRSDEAQPYPQQPWAGQDQQQPPYDPQQGYPYQGTGEYEQYRY